MAIKKHTEEFYYWRDLVNAVEKKSGKSIRDWAGKFRRKSSKLEDYPVSRWAIKHGYDYKVLHDPVDEAGLKLRIKINEKYKTAKDGACLEEEIPYQDFWHYALDHMWEINNGVIRHFCPIETLEYLKEDDDKNLYWVQEILQLFVDVLKENNLPEEIPVKFEW